MHSWVAIVNRTTRRVPRILQWLPSKLMSDANARFIADELDEACRRDRASGRGPQAPTFSHISGRIRSAWPTWHHLSVLPVPALDLRLGVFMLSRPFPSLSR